MSQNNFDYLLLGRVLKLASPYRKIFVVAALLAVVLAPVAILRPYLIKVMVDNHIFHYDIPGMTRIALIIVGWFACKLSCNTCLSTTLPCWAKRLSAICGSGCLITSPASDLPILIKRQSERPPREPSMISKRSTRFFLRAPLRLLQTSLPCLPFSE